MTNDGRRRKRNVKIIQKRDINERYEELVNEVLKDQDVQAFIQANRERLTDEDIRKSYAKLYEFVQEKEISSKTIRQ